MGLLLINLSLFFVRILQSLNLTHGAAQRSDIYTPCVPVSSHSLIQEGDNGACSSRVCERNHHKVPPSGAEKIHGYGSDHFPSCLMSSAEQSVFH